MRVVAGDQSESPTGREGRFVATDDGRAEAKGARVPRPRSPLIIGGIALGLIAWMMVTIFLLVAWKLFS